MDILFSTLASIGSIFAGIAVARAFLQEQNPRKGYILLGMWVVMYLFFVLYLFTSIK